MKQLYFFSIVVFFLSSFSACTKEYPAPESDILFTKIPSSFSGVDFSNNVKQDTRLNVLSYNYLFNGGGVSIGDFNKDGLPDLFFTSNQEMDKLYINKGAFQFEDVTEKANLNQNRTINGLYSWSSGSTLVDINMDGHLDIYVCKSGPFGDKYMLHNQLYINNGDATFTEQAKAYGLDDDGYSTQAVFFDYDKDGDLDAYVLNHSVIFNASRRQIFEQMKNPNFVAQYSGNLYQNRDNKFQKVTNKAGLQRYSFGLGLIANDFNDDGYTDLYIANDYAIPDYLFINQGNDTFKEDIKNRMGHTSFNSMGVDAADINNDSHSDISILDMTPSDNFRSKANMGSMNIQSFNQLTGEFGFHHQYMFNSLQLNNGNGQFSEIGQQAKLDKTDWSWATLIADFDQDGWNDLYVSNGSRYDIMQKDFVDALKARRKKLKEVGIKMQPKEMQEWLDKLESHKLVNKAFKNTGNLQFEETAEAWGLTDATFSNGAAYADLDLDGDLDLVVNNIDDDALIYRNNAQQIASNNWVQIQLEGDEKDKLGLNAKVTVIAEGKRFFREMTLTRGYQSSVEPVLTFGLGDLSKIERIMVHWQDKTLQVLEDVAINQRITIKKSGKKVAQIGSKPTPIFVEKSELIQPLFKHQENNYDDFKKELLLPHKNSQHGPFTSVGDVNKDGLPDYFVGGAAGQAGQLFIQDKNGSFSPSNTQPWQADAASEDMQSLFFDYDNDSDLDLYVVSGGNEFDIAAPPLQDRLYQNDGQGNFTKTNAVLPKLTESGSTVVASDFNRDGQIDLFVGGRMQPGRYPYPARSFVLLQNNGKFEDKTETFAPELATPGIVTDAIIGDIDGDNKEDLIIVGEWMSPRIFRNVPNGLAEITPEEITKNTGWWNCIQASDIDQDGDLDFVLGNLGLNYKYQANQEEPFQIYANDFDESGNLDIVLGYFDNGVCYPLRGRQCSSEQMPFIKEKYPSYAKFASATLEDVYGEDLQQSYRLAATNFASSVLLNEGSGQFSLTNLPPEAQVSSVNGIIFHDFNKDKKLDMLLAGNLFASEVETTRNDAGQGLLLQGNGDGTFQPISFKNSGFYAPGDVKDIQFISLANQSAGVLVTNNNNVIQLYTFDE